MNFHLEFNVLFFHGLNGIFLGHGSVEFNQLWDKNERHFTVTEEGHSLLTLSESIGHSSDTIFSCPLQRLLKHPLDMLWVITVQGSTIYEHHEKVRDMRHQI